MPKTVKVTAELIEQSTKENSSHCMIAEAIKATIPKAKTVSVDLATIRYTVGRKRYIYLTPRPAQEALLKFDNGQAIEPWDLRLGQPVQVNERKPGQKSEGRVKVTKETNHVPQRRGGSTPPIGPLNNGIRKAAVQTGMVRRFGLKAMGRPVEQS